jgi:hypothetical protein
MDKSKKDALKMVFRKEIFEAFDKVVPKNRLFTGEISKMIEETTNILVKEVTIRTL